MARRSVDTFKAFRLLCCELVLFAAWVAGNDLAVFYSDHYSGY